MNKKIVLFFAIILFIDCCNELKTVSKTTPQTFKPVKSIGENWGFLYYKYNSDFPPRNEVNNKGNGTSLVEEWFKEGGVRFGKTGINNSKEGKWLSGDADFDENGNVFAKGVTWREEYFKNGLRDSIFRQFDGNGKIIYETTFKNGTGFWKEYHSNGELYFEIYTKKGYFTDTLRLHDDKGRVVGKRLYKKDSLIYSEGLPCFPYRPNSVPRD